MQKIKLVIWDLDETFWKGTLSEEGISSVDENIELVKTLTDRGIINSIVSKNDFNQAEAKLKELEIWKYFVFPQINWTSKGPLIQKVIQDCQLRAENVLFIDDNHINLEEAKFLNPGIHALTPDFIPKILSHPAFIGKNDVAHSRLNQYKILEKKSIEQLTYDDNIEFLKSCNIEIQELTGAQLFTYIDRAVELLERTNQLNFTKVRDNKEAFLTLLKDQQYSCSLIRVKDKFGDYGIVGVYVIDTKNNRLKHFTFSCRILNLGIPQFIYAKLGCPNIEIIPDVAESLESKLNIDWITETHFDPQEEPSNTSNSKKIRVLLKGGCDLAQVTYYLKDKNLSVIEETNYVAENGFSLHQEHTQTLLNALRLSDDLKKSIYKSTHLPFIDEQYYETKVFEGKYDLLVYSLLMDYSQELYLHKKEGYKVAYGGYKLSLTDITLEDKIIEDHKSRNLVFERDQLRNFRDEFESVGQISAEDFISNLRELRSLIPKDLPIIFINGAEIDSTHPSEGQAKERHKKMNTALDKFIKDHPNTYLLDMRPLVTSQHQLTNNIRHYKRSVYQAMSVELVTLTNSIFNQKIDVSINLQSKMNDQLFEVFEPIIKSLKKIKRRLR